MTVAFILLMMNVHCYARGWHVRYDTIYVDTTAWQGEVNTGQGLPRESSLISAVEYDGYYLLLLYHPAFRPSARVLWYDTQTLEAVRKPEPPSVGTGLVLRDDSLFMKDCDEDPDIWWNPQKGRWQETDRRGVEKIYEDAEWLVYTPPAFRDDDNVLHAHTAAIFRHKATGKEYSYPSMLYLRRIDGKFYGLGGRTLKVIDDPCTGSMTQVYSQQAVRFAVNDKVVSREEAMNDPNTYIVAPFWVRGKSYLVMSTPDGLQVVNLKKGICKTVLTLNGTYRVFNFYNSFYWLRKSNLKPDEVWTELIDFRTNTPAFMQIKGKEIRIVTIKITTRLRAQSVLMTDSG